MSRSGHDGPDDRDGRHLRSSSESRQGEILVCVSNGEIESVRVGSEEYSYPEDPSVPFGQVSCDSFDLSNSGGFVPESSFGVSLFLQLMEDVFGRIEGVGVSRRVGRHGEKDLFFLLSPR